MQSSVSTALFGHQRIGFVCNTDCPGLFPFSSATVAGVDTVFEDFVFVLAKNPDELLSTRPVDDTLVGYIVIHIWKNIFVKLNESVQTTLSNIQRANTRQKVISNEETEKDEIVDNPLNIPFHT